MADVQLMLRLVYDAPMQVPVTALRAELRAWLARVGEGHDVVVTERGRPVARLVPVRPAGAGGGLPPAGVSRARERAPARGRTAG